MGKYQTTTRGSMDVQHLPNAEALKNCFEIVTDSEVGDYMFNQCSKLGLPNEVLDVVGNFARKLHLMKDGRSNPFAGNPAEILDPAAHFQKMITIDAAKTIKEQAPQGLHVGFAVNDESKILRAVSVDKKLVEPEVANAQDSLFSAWLFNHHAACEDATIYATVDSVENNMRGRQIETNSKNQPVTFPADRLAKLMTDPGKDGYAAFLKRQGIEATIQQRNYPDSKPAQQVVTEERPRPVTQKPDAPTPSGGVQNN